MKVRIDIDTSTFVRFWLVVLAFALGILAIYSARTALVIIGIALFLALALNPPVSWLASKLPGKSRVGGTAIAYVVVVLVLAAFAFLVVPPIVQQTAKFADTVPSLIDNVSNQYQGVNEFIDKYHLQTQVDELVNSIKQSATGMATSLGTNILSGLGSLFSIIAAALLILVLVFLMLVEGPIWMKRLWGVYQDKERMETHKRVLGRMYSVVTGYVNGQLAISAMGATGGGLVVFILSLIFNVPANLAVPAAAILFVMALIPLFGATIGAVIVGVLLGFNDITAAIVFIIYYIIYQQIENNFIAPTIQARQLDLSALAVLVSITVGVYVFGIAGGIISIPVAGCIKVLIEEYFKWAAIKRARSDRPLAKFVKKLQGDD